MKKFTLFAIVLMLVACSSAPSDEDIQKAIEETQTYNQTATALVEETQTYNQTATALADVKPIEITKVVPQTVEVTRIVERTVFPTKTKNTQSLSEAIIGKWELLAGTEEYFIEFFPLKNSGEGRITVTIQGITGDGIYEFIDEDAISVLWSNFNTPEIHHLKLIGNTLTIEAGGIPYKYLRVK